MKANSEKCGSSASKLMSNIACTKLRDITRNLLLFRNFNNLIYDYKINRISQQTLTWANIDMALKYQYTL